MRFIIAVFLLMATSSAMSRDIVGKITGLNSYSDGHTFVSIENAPANACADSYRYSLGVRGQDVKAPNMLSIALAAYMTGKSVFIVSADGQCQGGQEKVTFISLQ